MVNEAGGQLQPLILSGHQEHQDSCEKRSAAFGNARVNWQRIFGGFFVFDI